MASSNAKLALFYDWLFFNPDKDNIMNIEPAILVMHHSMRPHPAITATLLDFLCRIIGNFFPRERDKVHQGISNSLKTILEKRVLPSLQPLFDNPRLDEELKSMLRERFPFFVTGRAAAAAGDTDHHHQQQMLHGQHSQQQQHPPVLDREDSGGGGGDNEVAFSDDEEENKEEEDDDDDEDGKPLARTANSSGKRSKGEKGHGKKKGSKSGSTHASSSSPPEELDDSVKEVLDKLDKEKGPERRCELVDSLARTAAAEEFGFEQCSALAQRLAGALASDFEGKMFPQKQDDGGEDGDEATEEAVEESVGRPIFVLFRALCETSDADPGRSVLLQVLAELYALQPRVGYYLLYFLSADPKARSAAARDRAAAYRDLCEAIDDKYSLDICLVNDMRQCQEDDVSLFVFLLPDLFACLPKAAVGNTDLLYLVVSCVDGRQVQRLVCRVLARDFSMFRRDGFASVLGSSMGWETFEQYALWQLAAAHDLPLLECASPLVPRMDARRHAEALTAVLLLLKRERPAAELLKVLFSREAPTLTSLPPGGGDRFVSSVLTHWMHEYQDRLGDLVASHLAKQVSQSGTGSEGGGGGGTKSKWGGGGWGGGGVSHSAELTLKHLDHLRQVCKQQQEFFSLRGMQTSLQQARHACSEVQKRRFMDLFALADSDSEQEGSSPPLSQHQSKKKKVGLAGGSGSSAGKSPAKKSSSSSARNSRLANNDTSSEESSESSDQEKPPASSSRAASKSSSSSRSRSNTGPSGKNPRKRANKVASYKISSDESSEDEEVTIRRPKKKKKVSHSDSD